MSSASPRNFFQGLGRCNRNSQHKLARLAHADRLQGGAGGCAGRNAIVDHDHGATGNLRMRAIAEVELAAPFDLGELLGREWH